MVLENILESINHSREQRGYFANLILEDPSLLPEVLDICARVDEDISCRACWGLEFVAKHHLELLLPHLDRILTITTKTYKDSAVRPLAKIFESLAIAYYKTKTPVFRESLTIQQRERMTEVCFDWMITDQKIASQAYSMVTLYLLGTEFDWVHPELKMILENNYPTASAGYKARSRMVLKKIG